MMNDNLQDHLWDLIAAQRGTVEVPRVKMDERFATFDVRFKLRIPRTLYYQLDEIGRKQDRSPRRIIRRAVWGALTTLLPAESQ